MKRDEALGNFVAEVSPALLSFYFVISFFVTNSMVQLAFPGSLASFDRRMSETGADSLNRKNVIKSREHVRTIADDQTGSRPN